MEFVTLSEQEYDGYAKKHSCANFLNSIYSGRKFEKKQWKTEYLGLKEQEQIVAATLLVSTPLRKYRYFYAPRGFLMEFHDQALIKVFTDHLQAHMKKQNGLYLKVDPYVPYRQHDENGDIVADGFCNEDVLANLRACGYEHQGFSIGYDEASQCRWMSVLDLKDKTKEQVLKEMNSQTRQNVKNTIKNNIKVRELAFDELHILDEIVDVTSERRGFSNLSLAYYEEEYDIFKEHAKAYFAYLDLDDYLARIYADREKEEAVVQAAKEALKENEHSKNSKTRLQTATQHLESLAKREKEALELQKDHAHVVPLAAAMFIKYGNEIIYLTSGSYDQYKRFKGPYALQWHMIQMAIEEGYRYYNFYGISGLFEKEQEGYGVFDFKRGFRADVVELLGDFILPIQPKAYKTYRTMQKVKAKLKGNA